MRDHRDVHGIPDSNPSHHPEDGDGVCEKGETVIKTTPSGNRVNVPCHADKGERRRRKAQGARQQRTTAAATTTTKVTGE